MTAFNGLLFFTADDGVNGRELWRSDGTEEGTLLVKDINPGGNGPMAFDQPLVAFAGGLYFSAQDGATGLELWKTDGTAAGTGIVADIYTGWSSSGPGGLTAVNGVLFFTAYDGVGTNNGLWKSDGTAGGTIAVQKNMWPEMFDFVDYGGVLYFAVWSNPSDLGALYRSDGTPGGTVSVKSFDSGASRLTIVSGTLFFTASDGTSGVELWKSDGTTAGTVLVADIRAGFSGSSPNLLTAVGTKVMFAADDGVSGTELWASDGTTAGTALVRDIRPGSLGSISTGLAEFSSIGGTLYFAADDGATYYEPWQSDGTMAGTELIADLRAGGAGLGSLPNGFTEMEGLVYFAANNGFTGEELWMLNPDPLGRISGHVYAEAVAPANALAGALVQACSPGGCSMAVTTTSGSFTIYGLADGEYTLTASGPGGTSLLPGSTGPANIANASAVNGLTIVLEDTNALPPGTGITNRFVGPEGIPVLNWEQPSLLTTSGCAGAFATYIVTLASDGSVIASGQMTESPGGSYSALIPAFEPNAGYAVVIITIDCPGGDPDEQISFDIYIDPSGFVKTPADTPVDGATVTLYRSDTPVGPFAVVPEGSGLMSVANRSNPGTTDATGHFGWDVLAGYYIVRAERVGCYNPNDPEQSYVETAVLIVPPPVTDVVLRLECPGLDDADGDGYVYVLDNCPAVANPLQENSDSGPPPPAGNAGAIGNGPGIPGDDVTVPNGDGLGDTCDLDNDNDGLADVDELSPTACAPFDLSGTTHPSPAGGDITNDDDGDGNPAPFMGTDAADNGPSWDTDNDGTLDGWECANGYDPRDAGTRPAPVMGDVDSDGDDLLDSWEARGWGTDPGLVDSDGDGIGDCTEAADVDGNGVVNFSGDVIYHAKAALLPSSFGKTQDFDLDKNGVVNFSGDVITAARFALLAGLCA